MKISSLIKNMQKQGKAKALSPIVLLTLAACGGNEEGDGNQGLSFTTNENATTLLIGSVLVGSESASGSTFSLSGDDANSFEVSAAGELSLKEAANFEVKDSYSITIDVATTTSSEVEGEEPTVSTASRDFTVTVVNVDDLATGALAVTGTSAQGETLIADTSKIKDEDGIGSISYQWYRDGELITGSNDSELVLTQEDVGAVISSDISYVDGSGATETFAIEGTAVVSNTNDVATGAPTVTGTLSQNRELTVDTSSIVDADGLGEFSYQWNRDGVAIEGATAETYTLDELDIGANISVTVSFTDGFGAPESVVSAETSDITEANDAPTGELVINGTAAEGQTLTLDTSDIADENGLGTFSHVWIKDGEVLTGETGSTYTLSQGDVGSVFTASVNFVDGLGGTETVAADPTATVVNVNDDPTGSLTLSGTVEKGSTLTLDSSTIADEDGLGDFTFTWLVDGTEITGAAGRTFTLTADEVGKAVSAEISYTDDQGRAETVKSAETSSVKDVIVESVGAFSVTNSGTSASPVLEFYLDATKDPGGDGVESFDVFLDFTATEASYGSFSFAAGLLGNANDTDASAGNIIVGAIAFPNFTDLSTPLFTMNMTDLDTTADFAITVSGVNVDGSDLEGSTVLIA